MNYILCFVFAFALFVLTLTTQSNHGHTFSGQLISLVLACGSLYFLAIGFFALPWR